MFFMEIGSLIWLLWQLSYMGKIKLNKSIANDCEIPGHFKHFHSPIFSNRSIFSAGHLNLMGHGTRRRSGDAKVLGELPVPGRPTNMDHSRVRAYRACSGCGWGLFGYFYSRLSFLFSFSLSLGDGPI